MKKNNYINDLLFLAICLLLNSCAQVVMPGGGKKDTTPPRVVKYLPDSAQTNFNSKSIELVFSEYIQLKDLNSQLIISPPLKTTPDITVKNKSVNIVFDKAETLKPNTTYSISFGNSIQDITENNPIENFRYIFSTGSYIDSLSLNGKVENAFNHSTEKSILVMLYSDTDDSVAFKRLPDYFAKTKEDGTFQINNIKEGKYKLVVLKDGNANYKYNEGESIGFIGAPIDVSEHKNILIDLFEGPSKRFYLKKAIYDSYGKMIFVFNKPADNFSIEPINYTMDKGDELLKFSVNRDTVTYWFRNMTKDNFKFRIKNGSTVMDTLQYKLIVKEDALKSKRHPLKLTIQNNFNGNQTFDINGEIKLQMSQPIANIDYKSKISFKEETKDNYSGNMLFNKMRFPCDQILQMTSWDSVHQIEDLNNPGAFIVAPQFHPLKLKESTNYHLFIPPATFTDFFGLTNDTIKIDFKTQEEKFYGSVKLKITIPPAKGQYIVQLMDDKENIIRENNITKSDVLTYEYLHPQQYKVKIIYDDNNNGKWDTGDYINKIQPEKVVYYNGAILIRSNWDADLEWKITND